jgi:hypothetical protein
MPKSLKRRTTRDRHHATDSAPQPGDFPLGSPESRAAARAKVGRMLEMTPYDSDCFSILSMNACVNYQHSPNYSDIQDTEAYLRGWELWTTMYPIIPMHLDPFNKQESRFSHCRETYGVFHALRNKVPIAGDVLRRDEVILIWGVEAVAQEIADFRSAWNRQLPQFRCPIRFEDDKQWLRSAESKRGEDSWEEDDDRCTASELWSIIEVEALGGRAAETDSRDEIRAVIFREDKTEAFYTEPLEFAGQPVAV